MKYTILLRILLLTLSSLLIHSLHATHNRAGEIRVEQLDNSLTVRATVVTYTAILGASQQADRDSILIDWGDGTSTIVYRQNGPIGTNGYPEGELIGNDLQINVYAEEHTYSGRGSYAISMEDPNRIADIENINNSVEKVFYIRTVFTFLDQNFQGSNSTPQLLQPPIDDGCVGQLFTHNPNAFDPDGDSLAYRLAIPLGRGGVPLESYRFPSEFGSTGQTSAFRINETTGTLTWDKPRRSGNFNTVILIISYRNGIAIDSTVRDMQIFIDDCENKPPLVEVQEEFCLVAGETLTLNPVATAPSEEPNQRVLLEVTSAALGLDFQPATWSGNALYNPQPYSAEFRWETACEHVARYPYKAIFKATDDVEATDPTERNLSYLKVSQLKVSAPPPNNVQISNDNGMVELSWEAPYSCEDAMEDYFYGFSIWRRENSNPFPYDSCQQGLEGKGYTRISRRANDLVNGRFQFIDDDIERGRTYCYRILGQFVRYTNTGRPYNLVESIPSVEVCVQSSRDLPLLTKVSIETTDANNGTIDLRWIPPTAEDLDTIQNPPPYQYQILRSSGVGTSDFTPIAGTLRSFDSYAALTRDTAYTDTGLNTLEQGYTYAVEFQIDGDDQNIAPLPSSSPFLRVLSSDRQNRLEVDVATSWQNEEYIFLRRNGMMFDTIARTETPSYLDENLTNLQEYCYKVVTLGSYGVATIHSPLVNDSQEACGTPQDTVPPCPPAFTVTTLCDANTTVDSDPPYETTVRWTFGGACEASGDLVAVNVYRAQDATGAGGEFLERVPYPDRRQTVLTSDNDIAGCYYLTAVDSLGNESKPSETICVENCPLYELPNVFTPNGDNQNDTLVPRINRFISSVEFVLFNRWGVQVYDTTDPALGWDGLLDGGEEASEGTYYYTCTVYERTSDGSERILEELQLSGYIELVRNK